MTERFLKFGAAGLLCCVIGVGAAPQAKPKGEASKGKEVFATQCSVCHNVDTPEKKMGPSLKGLFKRPKMVTGKRMTEENVREQINNGGNGMPAYGDMLTPEDRENVIAYLKTV